jgi:hypothetical protein
MNEHRHDDRLGELFRQFRYTEGHLGRRLARPTGQKDCSAGISEIAKLRSLVGAMDAHIGDSSGGRDVTDVIRSAQATVRRLEEKVKRQCVKAI